MAAVRRLAANAAKDNPAVTAVTSRCVFISSLRDLAFVAPLDKVCSKHRNKEGGTTMLRMPRQPLSDDPVLP